MYKQNKPEKTSIHYNESYEGETIEAKIRRMLLNKEPIKDPGTMLQYSDRADGVLPEYDIRTDKWENAVELADKVQKTYQAQRDERLGKKAKEGMEKEAKSDQKPGDGKAESTAATDK